MTDCLIAELIKAKNDSNQMSEQMEKREKDMKKREEDMKKREEDMKKREENPDNAPQTVPVYIKYKAPHIVNNIKYDPLSLKFYEEMEKKRSYRIKLDKQLEGNSKIQQFNGSDEDIDLNELFG